MTYRAKCTKVKIDHKSKASKREEDDDKTQKKNLQGKERERERNHMVFFVLDVDIITYIGFNFLTTNMSVCVCIETGIL